MLYLELRQRVFQDFIRTPRRVFKHTVVRVGVVGSCVRVGELGKKRTLRGRKGLFGENGREWYLEQRPNYPAQSARWIFFYGGPNPPKINFSQISRKICVLREKHLSLKLFLVKFPMKWCIQTLTYLAPPLTPQSRRKYTTVSEYPWNALCIVG